MPKIAETRVEDLRPCEFNVVIELDPIEEKTSGGIILTGDRVDRDRLEDTAGTLVSASPYAFNEDIWPAEAPKPAKGDRVYFARYAGILTEMADGRWVRVVKDRDIVAIIDRKESEAPRLAA